MSRFFSFLSAITWSVLATAQLTGVSIESVLTHDASIDASLDGFTTYRVYAQVTSSTDFVSAVFGDASYPLVIGCTGTIHQSEGFTFNYATEVNPLFFGAFPAFEYDSWLTIGSMDANGGVDVQNTENTMAPALALFNAGEGFTISDPIGASWFNVFPCNAAETIEDCAAGSLAFGGEDNRVLIAQITATGDVYGILNLQVFPNGVHADNEISGGVTFSTNDNDVFGCTNAEATNYDMTATLDDFSCILPCALSLSVENVQPPSCNGENDALIQVVTSGAQGADYFYLNAIEGSGQNWGDFGSLVADNYTVYVVDDAGCTDSLDVEVPVTEVVEINAELTSAVSCNGAEDAVISVVETTGGSGTYEYYISNNPTVLTTQTEWTGLSGGQVLSVYAIDSNQCIGVSNAVAISDPTPISVGIGWAGVVDASCANTSDGQIYLDAIGGSAPATIQFSVDGENFSPSPLNVSAGTYTVLAQDANGCIGTLDDEVVVGSGACDISGCTNPLATGGCGGVGSYNPDATIDDGSCLFDHPCSSMCTTFSECSGDEDGNGICDNIEDSLSACLDPLACNYYAYTSEDFPGIPCFDDGSCIYEGCYGCPNWEACNYEPTALLPCFDCCVFSEDIYGESFYDCDGNCWSDLDGDGICDEVDDCFGSLDECGVCEGTGIPEGECDCFGNVLDACGICGGQGIPAGACDCDGNITDAIGVCGGSCTLDNDGNGVCDNEEVYGCSYALAENYSAAVTRDDGSCLFPCEGVVNINVFDWDGDYAVTVTDFLMMLSVYGDVDVDLDGIWDSGDLCVDTDACNYATDPSEPCASLDVLGICGGGCEADEDADGICDDVDTCVGIEDECGVCNGPGPTEIVIEDITVLYDSVYLPQLDEWYVYEFGADTTFSYTCAPPSFSTCGDPVSYQGYDYATVIIGEQCWFAENLRSESYENGDVIPASLNDSEWSSTTSGAVAVFGEGSSYCEEDSPDGEPCDEAWSLIEYGRLYNWYAVDDARGLCPSGWHVPTDGEWTVMTDHLGGESVAGGHMKATYGWYVDGNGSNSSGFAGLPGGSRFSGGDFGNAGEAGIWWSSSPSGSDAWLRLLWAGDVHSVLRIHDNQQTGFSVRCVQDAE